MAFSHCQPLDYAIIILLHVWRNAFYLAHVSLWIMNLMKRSLFHDRWLKFFWLMMRVICKWKIQVVRFSRSYIQGRFINNEATIHHGLWCMASSTILLFELLKDCWGQLRHSTMIRNPVSERSSQHIDIREDNNIEDHKAHERRNWTVSLVMKLLYIIISSKGLCNFYFYFHHACRLT